MSNQEVNVAIDQVVSGKGVEGFAALDTETQALIAKGACARIASMLDDKTGSGSLPEEVSSVGSFMGQVDWKLAIDAIKTQIGLERVVKHDIDSHPVWGELLTKLSEKHHAETKK